MLYFPQHTTKINARTYPQHARSNVPQQYHYLLDSTKETKNRRMIWAKKESGIRIRAPQVLPSTDELSTEHPEKSVATARLKLGGNRIERLSRRQT